MKRWVHASEELPSGYLGTTKFTTPSIRSNDQRNALEAFELAISQKFKQFDMMCEITMHLTSESFWQGTVEEYPEGYYIQVEGTRSGFQAFVSGDDVIRKPRKLSPMIGYYDIQGTSGTVYWMSGRKTRS